MLSSEQIAQGEELLKASTPGKWDLWHNDPSWLVAYYGKEDTDFSNITLGIDTATAREEDVKLVLFLVDNASALLEAAKEVHGMKREMEGLESDFESYKFNHSS